MKKANLKKSTKCPSCQGIGITPKHLWRIKNHPQWCPRCGGSGGAVPYLPQKPLQKTPRK